VAIFLPEKKAKKGGGWYFYPLALLSQPCAQNKAIFGLQNKKEGVIQNITSSI